MVRGDFKARTGVMMDFGNTEWSRVYGIGVRKSKWAHEVGGGGECTGVD